jgi:dienelactone hydrolase
MEETLKGPHYEPFGWLQWPEHPAMSFQFRRTLGKSQEGGSSVSECFQVASRMIPGDKESWHTEWIRVAERNHKRGDDAEEAGHIRTAMNCWLRASEYYRQAEFWLLPEDPRRLKTFDQCEAVTHKFLQYLNPPGEILEIPYENGKTLFAYFVRAPFAIEKQPVMICCGGMDAFKDELWFMVTHGALQRGISVLMFDGPGQGGTLRRHKIPTRYDYEVPVGYCIDYLETRRDVDLSRIAICGSSLGGYYAPRAASFDGRLAACISHGAIYSIYQGYQGGNRWDFKAESRKREQVRWVFGAQTFEEAIEKTRLFTIVNVLEHMKCPYLIVHGSHDVNNIERAKMVYDYAMSKSVNVTLRMINAEETGADHCQSDNPTIGQEIIADWLTERFGVNEKEILKKSIESLF